MISLRRRPDRLAAFWDRIAAAWPGQAVEVFPAIDGQLLKPPTGWRESRGAWGVTLSHAAVIGQTLMDGVDSLLVLEDDATFVPGFADRLAGLAIPADCEMLYLGGEHLLPPEPGPPGFVKGQNVNRCHAYAMLGRPVLGLVHEHLQWNPARWTAAHNVDHQIGILHEQGRVAVYAADPWLCGQAAGPSDIDGRTWPERWWPT